MLKNILNVQNKKGIILFGLVLLCLLIFVPSKKASAYNTATFVDRTVTIYSQYPCTLQTYTVKDSTQEVLATGNVGQSGWKCSNSEDSPAGQTVYVTAWTYDASLQVYKATLRIYAYCYHDTPYLKAYHSSNNDWTFVNFVLNSTTTSIYYQPQANTYGTDYSVQEIGANLGKSNVSTIYINWKPINSTITTKHYKYNSSKQTYVEQTNDKTVETVRNNTVFHPKKKNYTGYYVVKYDPSDSFTVTKNKTVNLFYNPNSYTVKFSSNLSSNSVSNIPGDMKCTYDVSKQISSNVPTSFGYYFTGWNTKADGSGTSYSPGQNVSNLTTTNNGTVTLYAQWKSVAVTIVYKANGGTGNDISIGTFAVTDSITLKNECFTKPSNRNCTFQGWAFDSDSTYCDFSSAAKIKIYDLYSKWYSSTKKSGTLNSATITLYAVWDDYPSIIVKNRYYSLSDAQAGNITETELFKTITITDREDGTLNLGETINNGRVSTVSSDFNFNEIKGLNGDTVKQITVTVTDSVGNKSSVFFTLTVTDSTEEREYTSYSVRFISSDYLTKSESEGGLNENSIWKQSTFLTELTNALNAASKTNSTTVSTSSSEYGNVSAKVSGSGTSNAEPVKSYTFTSSDIKNVKAYVKTNGLGNLTSDNGISDFIEQFRSCRTK